ncbi:unknown [Clostridium sp. CAG:729]|nr:unknown [Clostridium sp. CAG:729]
MEPKDFLFDDNEKNTNKPALQNINQNYKNFARKI